MQTLESRFRGICRKVEGYRQVSGFDAAYGDTHEETNRITPVNPWHRRILSELDFCLQMKVHAGTDVEAPVSAALSVLEEAVKADGVITDAACQRAEDCLLPLAEEARTYTLLMVGHAHLDMNWMWSWDETVAAVVATFRTMLRLMEEYPDFYFSQSQASTYHLVEEYARAGIPESRLLPLGIPVSERFNMRTDKHEARRQLGIREERPCVLIMSGSMGFGDAGALIRGLVKRYADSISIVLLGGSNRQLKESVRMEFGGRENVTVVDFTPLVSLYMDAADLLLTKPGGLTSTEAAVCNIPIIHTKPIPGCETQNSRFFVKNGMSISAKTTDGLIKQGIKLFRDDKQKAVMIKNQSDIISKNSSMNIYNLVKNNLEK